MSLPEYKLRCFLAAAAFIISIASAAQGLKASGKKIVDENGKEVILRGIGLGGWMLQEPYMMEMSGFASTQWQMKDKIQSLVGEANMQAFYNAWHSNHCTKADIDSLASWGFNSVRLPMHYNLFTLPIELEPVPGQNTWLEKGFAMTDSLISWCKAHRMYVILDLHAAPGGQGKDAAISDYNSSKPSLWESEDNKTKTIALWRKLAERYANEPWVGGYDLINEPNWSFTAGGNQNGCTESSNAPLRQLYLKITNAIREVDTKHIIIIEGNCWGNTYTGIFPLWDNNMAVSFHKYWSVNDQNVIQFILNVRTTYNVPIWLGESGENSNQWFTEEIQLIEKNGIGWAWWPLKKISSVVGPLTIVKTDSYQTLLDYWNKGGTTPSAIFANYTLLQMAENANIRQCVFHKDVIDAMFRQVYDSTTIPFARHKIPGIIPATDYDLGRCGKAYLDVDFANYKVTTGVYTAWNSGSSYRNDGVDIEASRDSAPGANGFDVGWTQDNEWMQYTVRVDSTAVYNVKFRYATTITGSNVKLKLNDADITSGVSLPATGGYGTWADYILNDVILYKGQQKIKLFFEKGGANFSLMEFSLSKKIEEAELLPVSAETYKQTELVYLTCNKILIDSTIKSNGFSCEVNGQPVNITSINLNSANPSQVIITLGQKIFDIDDIRLNYTNGKVKSIDGTILQNFTNLEVKNNLPVFLLIPGKIEAEAFTINQGLQLEYTTDIGGGKDIGYTNTGDYLDYQVRIVKTAKYYAEVRVACYSTAGRIEIQQLNSSGVVINSAFLNIPVTGGWQSWISIGTAIDLTEGISTLRIKILQPEFNMNWYKFSETSQGLNENEPSVFSLYPNPAHDLVSIDIPGSVGKKKTLTIETVSGFPMKTIEVRDSEAGKTFSVKGLQRGFYVVNLDLAGIVHRNKLIIQ